VVDAVLRKRARALPLKLLLICLGLGALLICSMLLGLSVGPSDRGLEETWAALTGQIDSRSTVSVIIWQIRMPRVVLAAAVGAVLGVGGAVFQALLGNPLAEPYILGISGGSAVGALAAMLFGFSFFPGMTLAAFGGSILVLVIVFFLGVGRSTVNKDALLLGGVMMNAFCGALIMFFVAISRTTQLQQMLYWLMGDLSMMSGDRLPLLLVLLPFGVILLVETRPLNLLLSGRDAARSMGLSVERHIGLLLIATTFMVSVVVCQAGLIGFVGLVIPHVFRYLFGSDHRLLLPACMLGGASYLVFCDLMARVLPGQGEMPVGIITAIIGAPLFVVMLWGLRR